jgi:hypothetical protein
MTVLCTGGLPQPDPWPLARIRMTTPRLEFRLPRMSLRSWAAVAGEGVHEPGAQPFGIPWGTQPPLLRARSVLQWHWATRATWSAQRWTLETAQAQRIARLQRLRRHDFSDFSEIARQLP